MSRIGVFGGTFDPPHLGHLALAEWARETLALDRVVFIPAGVPPHKRRAGLLPASHRVAMTRLAVRGNPGFRVSTLETRRRGPSFTVDTLRALQRGRGLGRPRPSGPVRLFLLIGADSLREFHTWHDPGAILGLATLVVARRPDAGGGNARFRDVGLARAARVRWLDNPPLAISSSGIRARARAGRSLRYLVPAAVERYLRRRRLYRGAR